MWDLFKAILGTIGVLLGVIILVAIFETIFGGFFSALMGV